MKNEVSKNKELPPVEKEKTAGVLPRARELADKAWELFCPRSTETSRAPKDLADEAWNGLFGELTDTVRRAFAGIDALFRDLKGPGKVLSPEFLRSSALFLAKRFLVCTPGEIALVGAYYTVRAVVTSGDTPREALHGALAGMFSSVFSDVRLIAHLAGELEPSVEALAERLDDTLDLIAIEVTDLIIRSGEAAVYIGAHALLGAAKPVEDAVKMVYGSALTLKGEGEKAADFTDRDLLEAFKQRLDQTLDPGAFARRVGEAAESLGEAAAYVGLSTVAAAGLAAGGWTVAAGTAVIALTGLAAGGEMLQTVAGSGRALETRDVIVAAAAAAGAAAAAALTPVISEKLSSEKVKKAVFDPIAAVFNEKTGFFSKEVGVMIAGSVMEAGSAAVNAGLRETSSLAVRLTDAVLDPDRTPDLSAELQVWLSGILRGAVAGALSYNASVLVRRSSAFRSVYRALTGEEYVYRNKYEEFYESRIPRHVDTINQELEGKVHPETGVPYKKQIVEVDGERIEGVFPEFNSECDVDLPGSMLQSTDSVQFRECNRQLQAACEANPDLKAKFTETQLDQISKGLTPEDYTWHHDAKVGRMQMVDSETHNKTRHTGGRFLWGGGTENRYHAN